MLYKPFDIVKLNSITLEIWDIERVKLILFWNFLIFPQPACLNSDFKAKYLNHCEFINNMSHWNALQAHNSSEDFQICVLRSSRCGNCNIFLNNECYTVDSVQQNDIWQTTPAPDGTSVTWCFKLSPAKFVTWCSICITPWKFVEPDDKLWHPMRKKVQHGTSEATIYHRVTQFYHRVPQFFIGLCNFSTYFTMYPLPST